MSRRPSQVLNNRLAICYQLLRIPDNTEQMAASAVLGVANNVDFEFVNVRLAISGFNILEFNHDVDPRNYQVNSFRAASVLLGRVFEQRIRKDPANHNEDDVTNSQL